MTTKKLLDKPKTPNNGEQNEKINTELLKKFIEDYHTNCNYCNLKNTICVGKNCTEEIFKSLLVKSDSELKNDS